MSELSIEQVAGALAAAATVVVLPLAKAQGVVAAEVAAELTACLDTLAADPVHAGLPAGLREAELQALQVTLSIYAAGAPSAAGAANGKPGGTFHDAAVAWSASALAALGKERGSHGIRKVRRAPLPAGAAPPTLAQRRLEAEELLLVELDVVSGPRLLPEPFLSIFLDPRPDGTGWFEAYSLYVAWYLRSDKALTAALAAAPLPALAKTGVTLPELLEELYARARRIAQRLEARLAEAEAKPRAAATPEANTEVARFLDRLPGELAAHHGVPAPALAAAAAALRGEAGEWTRFEEQLEEQARSLAILLEELAAQAQPAATERAGPGRAALVAAAARALSLVRVGSFRPAAEALAKAGGGADRQVAAAYALAADWDGAKVAINRAINKATTGPVPRRREQSLVAARELSRVLEAAPRAEAHKAAIEICQTLLATGGGHLEGLARVDILLRLSRLAVRSPRGAEQLRALAAAAQGHALLSTEAKAALPPPLRVRLACAVGDVALALAAHGADRLEEAAAAYREGARLAAQSRDARLASELQVRLADLSVQRARGAAKDEASRHRAQALAALRAAQTPRLRARDPIWWCHVKLRIAEASLAAAGDGEAERETLRAGLVAAKAAVRMLPAAGMAERRSRGLMLVADLFLALAKAEREPRWRAHARAAYAEALAAVDAKAMPALWCSIEEAAAAAELADADALATGDLASLIQRLGAAVATAAAGAPARRSRLQKLRADALGLSGRRRLDLAQLKEAADTYREVLGQITPKSAPALWCQAWVGLAGTSREQVRLDPAFRTLPALIEELEAARRAAEGMKPPWIAVALARELRACRKAAGLPASANRTARTSSG